jgi:hypothetical protein
VTDESSQKTSTAYTDAYFWRPASATDPLNNVVHASYAPTSVESYMNFASTSTSDLLASGDALGRPIYSRVRQSQGSSTFDSVQTTCGWTATGSVTGPFTTLSVPMLLVPDRVLQEERRLLPLNTTQLDAFRARRTVEEARSPTRTTMTPFRQ